MVKRLHSKKCKNTGRTEKSAVAEEAQIKKKKVMNSFHNGGAFRGKNEGAESKLNTVKKWKKKVNKELKEEEEPKKEEQKEE